jgi:hypothetical protein
MTKEEHEKAVSEQMARDNVSRPLVFDPKYFTRKDWKVAGETYPYHEVKLPFIEQDGEDGCGCWPDEIAAVCQPLFEPNSGFSEMLILGPEGRGKSMLLASVVNSYFYQHRCGVQNSKWNPELCRMRRSTFAHDLKDTTFFQKSQACQYAAVVPEESSTVAHAMMSVCRTAPILYLDDCLDPDSTVSKDYWLNIKVILDGRRSRSIPCNDILSGGFVSHKLPTVLSSNSQPEDIRVRLDQGGFGKLMANAIVLVTVNKKWRRSLLDR